MTTDSEDGIGEWMLESPGPGMPNPFQAIVAGILVRHSQGRTFGSLIRNLPDEEAQILNTHVADCDEWRERLALMSAVQEVGDVGQ